MGAAPRTLIEGNWKSSALNGEIDALICVPATLLHSAAVLTADTRLRIGAQNCHHEDDALIRVIYLLR